jgi:hypothetical protein
LYEANDNDDEVFNPLEPNQYNNLNVDELDKLKKKRMTEINMDEVLRTRLEDLDTAESVSQATEDDNTSTLGDDVFSQYYTEDKDLDDMPSIEVPQNEIHKIVTSISEQTSTLQRELLGYHFKIKHLPFSSLKKLAEKGIIPKKLAKVPVLMCSLCQTGKQHKKPW